MTPAWATEATSEEVQRKRQEFWETRVQGSSEHWLALRAACEAADSSKPLTSHCRIYCDSKRIDYQKFLHNFVC